MNYQLLFVTEEAYSEETYQTKGEAEEAILQHPYREVPRIIEVIAWNQTQENV